MSKIFIAIAILVAAMTISPAKAATLPQDSRFGCDTNTWRTDNGQPCFFFKGDFWLVAGLYEADRLVESGPQHPRVSRVMMYRNSDIVCPSRKVHLEPRDVKEGRGSSVMTKTQLGRHDLRWHPVCAPGDWKPQVTVARINRVRPDKGSLLPESAPRVDLVNVDTKENNLGLLDTYKVEWQPSPPAPLVAVAPPPPPPPPPPIAPASPKMVKVTACMSSTEWANCSTGKWYASGGGKRTPYFSSQCGTVEMPEGTATMWYNTDRNHKVVFDFTHPEKSGRYPIN